MFQYFLCSCFLAGIFVTQISNAQAPFIKAGVADFSDIYSRTNEKYGTDIEPEVTDSH